MQKRIFLESNTANLEEILDLSKIQSHRTLSVPLLVFTCLCPLGPCPGFVMISLHLNVIASQYRMPLGMWLLPGVGSSGGAWVWCVFPVMGLVQGLLFWCVFPAMVVHYLRSAHIVQDFPVHRIHCCQVHGGCSWTRMRSNFSRFWSECVGIDQRFLG